MSKKFFEYFPPPIFLEMPHVGLNITPRAVRFIEIVKGKSGWEVGLFGEKKLENYNPSVPLPEDEELVAALKELKEKYKLHFIKAALPEEKAYVFETEIPRAAERVIRSNIEFHLEENVPLTLEEAIFDYHLIESGDFDGGAAATTTLAAAPTQRATVSVLPRALAEQYVDVFNQVGLIPISFLIESQAITRAIIKKGDRETYLIVHINDTKTDFSVVSEETVQFTSSVAIGAEDFTTAVIKQFKVSKDEAKKMKREKGFVKNKENMDLFFALISTASALKDEIERIYSYWHTHTEKGQVLNRPPIKKIILLGEEGSLVGFKEYLAETTRTDVVLANVWANLFSFNDYIPPIDACDALNFAVAIGLSLPHSN